MATFDKLDKLDERVDSKFRFVLLAARRAEQLIRGADPRVEVRSSKVARISMQELLADRVAWDYGPAPDSELTAAEGAEANASAEGQEVH